MSIAFIAGPLSGLFVQPLIGAVADSSTLRFGRRKPYMLVGSILCALAMLLLEFTKYIASWFLDRESNAVCNAMKGSQDYLYPRVQVGARRPLAPI